MHRLIRKIFVVFFVCLFVFAILRCNHLWYLSQFSLGLQYRPSTTENVCVYLRKENFRQINGLFWPYFCVCWMAWVTWTSSSSEIPIKWFSPELTDDNIDDVMTAAGQLNKNSVTVIDSGGWTSKERIVSCLVRSGSGEETMTRLLQRLWK